MSRRLSPLLMRAGFRYQLRHRWQAVLALVGIAMGVAVVLAVDLASGAAKASFALSAEQLRGKATHRLVGADGQVAHEVYQSLATTPGHPPMAPVVSTRIRIAGRDGPMQLIGVDLFAEAAFRTELRRAIEGQTMLADWLARPDVIALSASAAEALAVGVGSRVTLGHAGVAHDLEVLAIHPDDGIASRDIVLTDIATAQVIAGLGNDVGHIDLILDEAAETWLRSRLPTGVKLVEVAAQTAGIAGMSSAFELNLTAMSLLALLVGLFLIFNAVSYSVVQRRHLLGRLRALGVGGAEILRLILAEALLLGVIGALIGSVLGIWLGQSLTRIVAATVSELYYQVSADAMQVGWPVLAKAVLLGLGGTLLAAWLPARQAAGIPPLTTLSRAALEQSARAMAPRLGGLGILLLVGGPILAFKLPGGVIAGFVGLFMLLLGAASVTPFALQLAQALFVRLPIGGVWPMASRDLARHLSRLATAAAALMVALAASVGVALMVESMRDSVSDWLQALLSADLYIAAEGFDDGAALPAGIAARAAQQPGVSATSRYRNRALTLDDRPVKLVAADLAPQSRAGFGFLAVAAADPWQLYDRGAVMISEPLSNRTGLGAGDVLRLPTPRGERAFDVAGIFRDYASEHGRIFMPLELYRDIWSDDRTDTVALFGADARALRESAVAQLSSGQPLVFTPAREIYRESMAVFDRTFRITEVLRYLSLLVAVIGVFSALMAIQLERRKEYAVLRALGLTRGQIAGLIATESALLGLLAALLAVPTGLAMAWILTDAIQLRAFGWSMPFRVPLPPLLLTLLLGIAAALLASLYPAWGAARRDPAPQLRED